MQLHKQIWEQAQAGGKPVAHLVGEALSLLACDVACGYAEISIFSRDGEHRAPSVH